MKDTVTEGKALLAAQLERERRGYNLKRLKLILSPVQWMMWQQNSREKGILGRGTVNRRIIRSETVGHRRTEFHATKGPRSFRVPA